jgi:hypothetical protein
MSCVFFFCSPALLDAYELLYGRSRPQICDIVGRGAHAPIAGRVPGASATFSRAALVQAPPEFDFQNCEVDMSMLPLQRRL